MSSTAVVTLVKIVESLPDTAQEQVVEHLREYIATDSGGNSRISGFAVVVAARQLPRLNSTIMLIHQSWTSKRGTA